MTVAKTILNQLGGNKFVVMTGAKLFVDIGNGLQFKLPRFSGVKINSVRIVLDASDTYNIEFGRVRGTNYSVIKEVSGVYADQLTKIFRAETGLACSF